MKKTYITTAAIVSLCLIITAVTRVAANNFPKAQPVCENSVPNQTLAESTEASETEPPKIYIMTEKDGKIAVYQKGVTEPVRLTDTYLRDLPEFDQEKLKVGIEIYGDAALRRAIEDYCS